MRIIPRTYAPPTTSIGTSTRWGITGASEVSGRSASAVLSLLTTGIGVGSMANMSAQLITGFKNVNPDGSILELVVWRVPKPVPPSNHPYKYRAVYIVHGQRILGFDNERGKGDHRHVNDVELSYRFTTVEQLVEDFIAAVDAWRGS